MILSLTFCSSAFFQVQRVLTPEEVAQQNFQIWFGLAGLGKIYEGAIEGGAQGNLNDVQNALGSMNMMRNNTNAAVHRDQFFNDYDDALIMNANHQPNLLKLSCDADFKSPSWAIGIFSDTYSNLTISDYKNTLQKKMGICGFIGVNKNSNINESTNFLHTVAPFMFSSIYFGVQYKEWMLSVGPSFGLHMKVIEDITKLGGRNRILPHAGVGMFIKVDYIVSESIKITGFFHNIFWTVTNTPDHGIHYLGFAASVRVF